MAAKILHAACSGVMRIIRRRLPPEGTPDRPREAVSLISDGDEEDLVADVEQVFDVKFSIPELERCLTVGDLRDAVWRHMERRRTYENLRCMTAMAFYALRRALMADGTPRTIRLSDRLDSLARKPRDLARVVK